MPKKVDLTITQGRERPRDIIAKAERLSQNHIFNPGGVLGGGGGIGTGGPGFATDCPDCLPDCADVRLGEGSARPDESIPAADTLLLRCNFTGKFSKQPTAGQGGTTPAIGRLCSPENVMAECGAGLHPRSNHFFKIASSFTGLSSGGYNSVKIRCKARWVTDQPLPDNEVNFYINVPDSVMDGVQCETDLTDWDTSGDFAGSIVFSETDTSGNFSYDNVVHTLNLASVPTTNNIRVELPSHDSLGCLGESPPGIFGRTMNLLNPDVDFSGGGFQTQWQAVGGFEEGGAQGVIAGYAVANATKVGFNYELPVGAKEIDAVWFDDLPASRFLHWNIAENNAIEPVQTLQPSTVVKVRFLPYE